MVDMIKHLFSRTNFPKYCGVFVFIFVLFGTMKEQRWTVNFVLCHKILYNVLWQCSLTMRILQAKQACDWSLAVQAPLKVQGAITEALDIQVNWVNQILVNHGALGCHNEWAINGPSRSVVETQNLMADHFRIQLPWNPLELSLNGQVLK